MGSEMCIRDRYLYIPYTQLLADARIEQSTGSVGDSYPLAESSIGLYNTEVILRGAPGEALSRWSSPPWHGSTGSTIGVYSRSSGTDPSQRPRQPIIANASSRHEPRDIARKHLPSRGLDLVSARRGTVQNAVSLQCPPHSRLNAPEGRTLSV